MKPIALLDPTPVRAVLVDIDGLRSPAGVAEQIKHAVQAVLA